MTYPRTAPRKAENAFVLLSVCLNAISIPMIFSAPAVALTIIGRELGGSPVALNWVTNAFMLTLGSTMMAMGALADSFGRKRLFLAGTISFAVISGALPLAQDIIWFDLLRAAQGVAAAASFASGMAALAQEFEGPARLRAFSLVGASFGVGLTFGPISAGLMIDAFGWRSIFLLAIALAMPAFGLGWFAMRESRDPDAASLDWPGALSFTVALTLLTSAVLQAPESGWASATTVGLLAAAALSLAGFVAIERRVSRPMLDLSLFRYPRFVGVQLLAAAPAYAFVVLLILLPIRFVGIEGMSQVAAGRMMIALSGPLLILPLAAGLLTRWLSPATICGTGLAVSAIGLVWLSLVPLGAPHAAVGPFLMIGIGISLPWGLMDGLAVSVVPKERAGMAAGIFSTTRVAGEGVALAVVAAVLSALTTAHLPGTHNAAAAAQRLVTGDPEGAALLASTSRAVLADAYGDAFAALLMLLAAITAVTAIVVFLFLGRQTSDEEQRTTDQHGETEEAACSAPI